MKLLMFSSPLHYLVALLVKCYTDEKCVGLYVKHKKDCRKVFEDISDRLGVELEYVCNIDEIEDQKSIVEVVAANRFDSVQVSIIRHFRRKAIVSFMEEGASIYLKESHLGKGFRDNNYWLRSKDFARQLLGRQRYFAPMSWFSKGYSFCAADIPFLSPKCEVINLVSTFRSVTHQDNSKAALSDEAPKKRALILSQWFVAKGILSEHAMTNFYQWLDGTALVKYDEVYYKPHPWDDPEVTLRIKERFGFLTIQNEDIPVELWLAFNGDVDLYGFWTSTMIYCNGVLSNKSFSAMAALALYTGNHNIAHQYDVSKELLKKSGTVELIYSD